MSAMRVEWERTVQEKLQTLDQVPNAEEHRFVDFP